MKFQNSKAAMRPETKLVWIETPSNPLMKIVDLRAAIEVSRVRSRTNCRTFRVTPQWFATGRPTRFLGSSGKEANWRKTQRDDFRFLARRPDTLGSYSGRRFFFRASLALYKWGCHSWCL